MRSNNKDTSAIYKDYELRREISGVPNNKVEKISNKYKKRRKRKKCIRIVMILTSILIFSFIVIACQPKYHIKTIEVVGNRQMSQKQIIEDSTLKTGDNIFKMNTFLLEKRMKKNPFYGNVQIDRKYPDKVVIKVEERKPTIAFPYGDKYVLINSDGIVMKLSNENPKLSEIVGVTIKGMERGEVLETSDDELFEKSLEFLALVDENDLFFKRIDLRKKNAKLNVYDNLYVKGKLGDISARIKDGNLKKVLIDLYRKNIKRGTVVIDGDKTCSFTPKFN